MTKDEWANWMVERMAAAVDKNPWIDGPLVIEATADVYPGDMASLVSPEMIERVAVPDVAVVLRGTFRRSLGPEAATYSYMLFVADRDRGGYATIWSNDREELVNMLQ